MHNVEWETEAALAFLRLGAVHVKQGRAAAFYLHLCTTLITTTTTTYCCRLPEV